MRHMVFASLGAILFFMMNFATHAQNPAVSFGLRGGVDFQNINGKDYDGDELDLDLVTRFNAGVVVEIPAAPEFFIQTGLLYTTKGAKSENDFLGQNSSIDFNLAYLELPISLLYKPRLGNGYLLIGFGPYLAYGIGGRSTYTLNNVSVEEDVRFAKEYEGLEGLYTFKPFDFGANLFFGYELSGGLNIQLNTQLGLAAINPDDKSDPNTEASFKHTGFGLSLGYRF